MKGPNLAIILIRVVS